MKMIIAATLVLAGAARAAATAAPEKAKKIMETRASVREGRERLKRLAADQHKTLVLIRGREKSDLKMIGASAASGEAMHVARIETRERSRRQRLTLRASSRSERTRLKAAIKSARAEMAAQRRKK